jgi:N utilization substance protein B
LIYELDLREDLSPEEALKMYPFDGETDGVAEYAKSLVRAASARADEVDEILREHIVGWRTERMVAVDRAAIRIALCEGLLDRSVPIAVAISEAVELTKMFGTVESSKFVNGVLGRIVRSSDHEAGEDPEDAPEEAAEDISAETPEETPDDE